MSAFATFDVIFTMTSDWGVGSGAGRQGSIDRLIERDMESLPLLPATTIKGIWRDAAEQVAHSLDGAAGNSWRNLVDAIFGSQPVLDEKAGVRRSPVPSRLTVGDGRLSKGLRQCLAESELRAATTFVKPGVAIDPASGRAKTDFLRFDEMARKGAVLVAPCRLATTGDAAADLALTALCLAALRLVERIGGKRRRGAGSCSVSIAAARDLPFPPQPSKSANPGTSCILDAAVKALEEAARSVAPAVEPLVLGFVPTVDGWKNSADSTDWRKFGIDLEVTSPLLIANAVLGNVVTTLDFIPGGMLLPILTKTLIAAGLAPELVRSAIAAGDIRVLPAHPVVDGQRGLPVPFVWEQLKDATGGPWNTGVISNRLLATGEGTSDQKKPLRGGFVALGNGSIRKSDIDRRVRTHNTVEDERQKPTEAVGGVFTYETISPGSRFRSEVWIDTAIGLADLSAEALHRHLPQTARLGRAKSSGHGQVTFVSTALSDTVEARSGDGDVILYFASDTLIPASLARPSPLQALLHEIERSFGMKCSASEPVGDLRYRRLDGWLAAWSLPRPSLVAIGAGSVVRLKVEGDPSALAEKIQRIGLGSRRGEGFGHVLVGHPLVSEPLPDGPSIGTAPEKRSTATMARSDEGLAEQLTPLTAGEAAYFDLAVQEAEKARLRLLAEVATERAEDRKTLLGWNAELKMSQIGALRAAGGDFSEPRQVHAAERLLNGIAKKGEGAARPWGGTILRDGPAQSQHVFMVSPLTALLNDPTSSIAAMEKIIGDRHKQVKVSSHRAAESSESVGRYALRCLIFAAMRAHKRDLERRKAPSKGAK
jgi:CRISPR-associated protein Csx10